MTPVDRRGPVDAPVVVLVHGAGISRKMWLPQTESLSEEFQTVAPDLPGHGERADEPFRFEAAVETVEAVVRGGSATCIVLVGQSLGGYVATEVAARHPDRIAGLVLSGSSAEYRGWLGFRTAVSSLLFRLGARSHTVTDWFEGVMTERLRSLSLRFDSPFPSSSYRLDRTRSVRAGAYVYVASGSHPSPKGPRMPPDLITGRDIELIVVGVFSLLAGGVWAVEPDGSINVVPLGTFLLLASLSFLLAWLDIRSRGGLSIPRRE